MRLVVLLTLIACSAAPQAQERFLTMCGSNNPVSDVDYGAICSCAAARVLALGGTAAALDAVADFMAADIDLEGVPEDIIATSRAATSAVYACRSEAGIGTASDSALKARLEGPTASLEGSPTALEEVPMTPEAIAAEAAGSVPAVLPTGIRTGNGTAPVQARQQGKGAPIRIVG